MRGGKREMRLGSGEAALKWDLRRTSVSTLTISCRRKMRSEWVELKLKLEGHGGA